ITLSQLVSQTLSSLRETTSMSEKARAHHSAMTKVLIMQALVPMLSVQLPTGLALTCAIPGKHISIVFSLGLLAYSTNSFFESLVHITTTPIYRGRLHQWITRVCLHICVVAF
ncbi:hypothetical protein PMAYCL1PPCAC_09380, partial [Pristionchus mayeri]